MSSILGWWRDSRNPLKRNKLYDKYLKSKTNENEKEYKTYKYLFEILKEKSKKIYNSRKLENCKQNMKKKCETHLLLQTGIFPNGMKIAQVSPIFKKGEEFFFTNYRPISVLPCFSKLLERIMYNRLYKYLLQNNLFYEKQFGFQASNSMEHAVI